MNTFKKRIDELGRIVIPKEIRKTCKINDYDELDLMLEDNRIILTKSIGINFFKNKIEHYIDLIKNICKFDILIISDDHVVTSSIKNLSGKLDIKFDENENNLVKTILVGEKNLKGYMFFDKIIYDSNLLGYIVFIDNQEFNNITLLKSIKNVLVDIIN